MTQNPQNCLNKLETHYWKLQSSLDGIIFRSLLTAIGSKLVKRFSIKSLDSKIIKLSSEPQSSQKATRLRKLFTPKADNFC